MHIKRTIAYLIDLLFITSFMMIITYVLPQDLKSQKIKTEIDQIGEAYASSEMDQMTYFMTLSSLEKKLDQKEAILVVIDSILIVIYYIIIPYFFGTTLGRQLMKLKLTNIEGNKISLMSLFLRVFIMNGLFASILIVFGILVIPENFYLSFVSILAILQVLTLIVSFFMIKYRRDSLGLEDIFSHSRVIK